MTDTIESPVNLFTDDVLRELIASPAPGRTVTCEEPEIEALRIAT